ncbi:unnamed protein product [Parnassius mnemosyne]|uniref:Peptidase aspartic putative domain-containing protein n=1 Tax=Parnassius mnemosyne TaxID=213953 RepID=A0AAV1LH73_9NEOP
MAEEKIQKLIKLRSSIKSKVTILNKYVKVLQSGGPPSDLQLLDLEGRFKKFDALYAQYDELQSQIEVLSDDSDTQELEREEFEGQYYSLAAAARSVLGARPARQYEQPLNRSLSSYEYVSLQQTALVKVLDGTGAAHSARMLLDNGSTANFVMQSLCGKLGLSRRSVSSTVTDF